MFGCLTTFKFTGYIGQNAKVTVNYKFQTM
jgi:hypothetical protein